MSKNTKKKKWRRTMPLPKSRMTEAIRRLRECHMASHPDCTYGDQPHFIPPSFGDVGFFLCERPADIRNHTRCEAPFDHEHPEHFDWNLNG